MNEFKTIELILESDFAIIRLNNPARRNAFDQTMITEIIEALDLLDEDCVLKYVVIRGNGPSFCAGADLEWMTNTPELHSEKSNRLLAMLFNRLYLFNRPLIGIAHGSVFGGGIGLLATCDFVLAEDSAMFSFSELRLGLSPATILPYVLCRMSLTEAKKRILTAELFNADSALKIGLADFVGTQKEIDEKIDDLALQFRKNGTEAMIETKRLLRKIQPLHINSEIIEQTVQTIRKLRKSDEAKERIEKFLNKRTNSVK